MKNQFTSVDDHFARNDDEYAEYKEKVKKQFANHTKRLTNNDVEIKQIHVALKIGSDDREDLHKNCDFLTNQIELRRSEAAK